MLTLFWLLIIKIGHFGFKNLYFTLLRFEKNNQRKLSLKSIWMNREFKTLPKTLNILIQLPMRFVALFWNKKFSLFLDEKSRFVFQSPDAFFDEHYPVQCNQICTTFHMSPVKKKYEHASDEMVNLCIASDLFGLANKMTKNPLKTRQSIFIVWESFVMMNQTATGFFFTVINDHIDTDFMIPITEKRCISFKKKYSRFKYS